MSEPKPSKTVIGVGAPDPAPTAAAGDEGRAARPGTLLMRSPGGEDDSAPASRPARAPEDHRHLLGGRYRLIHPLGAGGMSTVHLAEHVKIGKRVAIKILAERHLGNAALTERFLREARATSQVRHPNVIEIDDFGETPEGAPFFVMELLDGENLGQLVHRGGPLPWPRVAHMTRQIAGALGAAHEVGVIHRDLKPDNCFRIERSGDPHFIKVIDFGIAKLTGALGASEGERLTRTGIVVGTPEYVAPEQARGKAIDHRVDVYALGIIMYELLTGRLPFEGENFAEVLTAQSYDPAPRFSEVAPELELPEGVEAIVRKALQKRPEHRFESMAALVEALSQVEGGGGFEGAGDDAEGRPDLTGPMHFAGAGASAALERVLIHERRSWRVPVLAGAGIGLVLALAGVIGIYGVDDRVDEAERLDAPGPELPADAEAPTLEPAPAPEARPQPAIVDRVTVRVDSNVEARVVDPLDGAVYGRSNDDEGFELPRGDEPVPLRLVAPGYADLDVQIVPTRDKRLEVQLEPRAKAPAHRRRAPPSLAREPEPEAEAEPAAIGDYSEIKDPFGR